MNNMWNHSKRKKTSILVETSPKKVRVWLQYLFYLHSCSPHGSWADSGLTGDVWRKPTSQVCPAHRCGIVGVCCVCWALTSCLVSFLIQQQMIQAAQQQLLQSLEKNVEKEWGVTWYSYGIHVALINMALWQLFTIKHWTNRSSVVDCSF